MLEIQIDSECADCENFQHYHSIYITLEQECKGCFGKGCHWCNNSGILLTNAGQTILELVKKYS